jgi:hypothetical protein
MPGTQMKARGGKYEELDRQSIPDRFTGHQEAQEGIKYRNDETARRNGQPEEPAAL